MNLVIDASVAAKWLFKELDAEQAQALRRDAERQGFELVAPEILPAEIANAIWKRVARGQLHPRNALTLFGEFQRICPILIRLSSLVEAALALSVRFRQSVYDSLYVALASERRCDLVTADEKLHRALGSSFPQVCLLRDWQP